MPSNEYNHHVLSVKEEQAIFRARDSSLEELKRYVPQLALAPMFLANYIREYINKEYLLRDARRIFSSFPRSPALSIATSLDTKIAEGIKILNDAVVNNSNPKSVSAYRQVQKYTPTPHFYLAVCDQLKNQNAQTAYALEQSVSSRKKRKIYHDHILRTGDSYDFTISIEEKLVQPAQSFQEQMDSMVTNNRRMVKRIVASTGAMLGAKREQYEDLESFGLMGLLEGFFRYKSNKNARFYTYAQHWVKQSISRGYTDISTIIRLPVHVHTTVAAINRAIRKFEKENGGIHPSEEEICAELDLSSAQYRRIENRGRISTHLDAPLFTDEPDTSYNDVIPSDFHEKLERHNELQLVDDVLQLILPSLNTSERDILFHRYGINDHKKMTLEEIGRKYGVTRERIRQREDEAIRKLKVATYKLMREKPEYMAALPQLPVVLMVR